MKHLQISLKLLVLLMAISLVAGCQKEDDNINEHTTTDTASDMDLKRISLEDLNQIQALKPHLNAIEKTFDIHKAKTNAQSKIIAADGSFTILTDEILQVTTSYSEAYTFRIETPSHPYADFENFVIQKDNNKTYQFYIYSYITLTLNGITDHYIFSAIEVDGDLINTTNFQDLLGAKMQMIGGCLYNVDEVTGNAEPIWCFGTDGGTDGGDGGDGGDDGGYQDGDIISIIPNGDGTCTITTAGTGPLGNPVKFVDRYADCPNGTDNGNPDDDDNDNNWDDDTHFNDNPPIEPGGSGTGNGNSNPTPIGTLPFVPYDQQIIQCLGPQPDNDTATAVTNWLDTASYLQIKNAATFFDNNECSEEAKAFFIAVADAGPDAEVDYLNVVIKDESFIDSQTDCIFEKLKANNNGDNFFKTMLEEFDILNSSLKFSIGTTPNPNAAAITKGSIVDFFGTSYASYEIVTSTNIENNSSNLDKMVTLSHEVMHAFMFKSLEEWGIIQFNSDGNPQLIQNTNDLCENVDLDEEVNLNLLTTKEKWVFLICEFLINNPTNTEEWTHSLFESPVFALETYREKLEQLLLNTHDWDNEPLLVRQTMVEIFGANIWKQKVAEYMSWSGLEDTSEFTTWLTTQNSFVPEGSIYSSNRDFFENGVTGYWTQNFNVTDNCN